MHEDSLSKVDGVNESSLAFPMDSSSAHKTIKPMNSNSKDDEGDSDGSSSSSNEPSSKVDLSNNRRFTFPWKLHQLLEDVRGDGLESVVSWTPSGRAFKVHKRQEFVDKILPTYFRQTSFKSFQRQLYIYGFTRVGAGTEKGAYQHPLFVYGERERSFQIDRRPQQVGTATAGHLPNLSYPTKGDEAILSMKNPKVPSSTFPLSKGDGLNKPSMLQCLTERLPSGTNLNQSLSGKVHEVFPSSMGLSSGQEAYFPRRFVPNQPFVPPSLGPSETGGHQQEKMDSFFLTQFTQGSSSNFNVGMSDKDRLYSESMAQGQAHFQTMGNNGTGMGLSVPSQAASGINTLSDFSSTPSDYPMQMMLQSLSEGGLIKSNQNAFANFDLQLPTSVSQGQGSVPVASLPFASMIHHNTNTSGSSLHDQHGQAYGNIQQSFAGHGNFFEPQVESRSQSQSQSSSTHQEAMVVRGGEGISNITGSSVAAQQANFLLQLQQASSSGNIPPFLPVRSWMNQTGSSLEQTETEEGFPNNDDGSDWLSKLERHFPPH